jgi:hypothetical protein
VTMIIKKRPLATEATNFDATEKRSKAYEYRGILLVLARYAKNTALFTRGLN